MDASGDDADAADDPGKDAGEDTGEDAGVDAGGGDAGPEYMFGAKHEPPVGRIIHGMGQYEGENERYLEMIEDEAFRPATELLFFDLDQARPWEFIVLRIGQFLERQREAGRIPNMNVSMSGTAGDSFAWWEHVDDPVYFGIDDQVANTDVFDARIVELGDVLADYEDPVFLRIGGEFNGLWNGFHPWQYPVAFRKIVRILRERGADNVAFIWCYEPAAADDFDEMNGEGQHKWFPGDDVIDWYAIDVFGVEEFDDSYPEWDRGEITRRGKTERFLQMALDHERPVMIAESSAAHVDIYDPGAWETWFVPYFEFLERHPHIEAFTYIAADWPNLGYGPEDIPWPWQDARVFAVPDLAARYVEELMDARYLHKNDIGLLCGG